MKKKKRISIFSFFLIMATVLAGCQSSTLATSADDFFTTDVVHTIDVQISDETYQSILDVYVNEGDKIWVKATVTIDGTAFEDAGLKLKGNSTLRGISNDRTTAAETTESAIEVTEENTQRGFPGNGGSGGGMNSSADSSKPETLPWIIRLDKYVDDAEYKGRSRFVIRGNNTETSFNEAVALAMLTEGGVETEKAAFTKVTMNGSEQALRLVIDVPDDDSWTEEHFGENGVLYKADGDGNYDYIDDNAESYVNAFEQKYGDDDMEPLIAFLDFINNATDDEFATDLNKYLDVDNFATYLAMQDLVHNDDDIDGPGNNGYLYYSYDTKQMTVVAWDQNLSFGGLGGGMGNGGERPDMPEGEMPSMENGEMPQGGPGNRERPQMPNGEMSSMENGEMPQGGPGNGERPTGFPGGEDGEMPEGFPGGNGGGPGMSNNNPLVTRFLENETYNKLYEDKTTELTEKLITSGYAEKLVDSYEQLLLDNVTNLIEKETIEEDANDIRQYLQ